MNPRQMQMSQEFAEWKVREIEHQIAHTSREEIKIMLSGDLRTWQRIASYYIAPLSSPRQEEKDHE